MHIRYFDHVHPLLLSATSPLPILSSTHSTFLTFLFCDPVGSTIFPLKRKLFPSLSKHCLSVLGGFMTVFQALFPFSFGSYIPFAPSSVMPPSLGEGHVVSYSELSVQTVTYSHYCDQLNLCSYYCPRLIKTEIDNTINRII